MGNYYGNHYYDSPGDFYIVDIPPQHAQYISIDFAIGIECLHDIELHVSDAVASDLQQCNSYLASV